MTIAITGASGKYGAAAVEELLRRVAPEELILITRSPAKLAALAARGCQVRRGDFDDQASMVEALRGAARMLLISTGRVGRRLPQHGAAIRAAAQAGVGHIVYTSFVGVADGNPALVIRDHGGTEAMLRDAGVAWTALRDSQYSDAMTEAAGPLALATGVWRSSTGEGRIAFVTREDCVACAVAVLVGEGHENRVYNITGPELLRFRDVSDIIAEVAARPIRYEAVSPEAMIAMFDAMGVPRDAVDDLVVQRFPWSSDDMISFEAAIRTGYFGVISDDVERLIGRKPQSFRHFAERHRDALRAIPQQPPESR